ncbi:MAG: heme ABC exporter ATP-binding protein CcmA [Alphaproteobacteria bacterium]|nr:heme ABC exporter ATP-binding protein CcmA [Alphaproteobacteria bacterium]
MLSLDDLAVARGERVLFQNLSLRVAAGEAIEITGSNGAGKTSLLRAIAGFLRPLSGTIAVPERSESLHFLGHRDGLKPTLTARAHARFWAALYQGDAARVAPALDRVGLSAIADLPARALSQGQARRLALTRLITAPRPIWLLDEPSAALDSAGKALLRDLIVEHLKTGGVALAALHESLGLPGARTLAL